MPCSREPAGRVSQRQSRAWMYFGQLPKDCCTATVKPSPSASTSGPFMRLRRRVGSSSPSRPRRASLCRLADSGSSASGRALTRSRVGSGERAKPGLPQSTEAWGWPSSSRLPTSRQGNWAKNSRCCSGMWLRITRIPTASSCSRTPRRAWMVCSPGWKGLFIWPPGPLQAGQFEVAGQGADAREPALEMGVGRQ
ncbi:hypothetical protein D3C72_1679280 [compost metagenome]